MKTAMFVLAGGCAFAAVIRNFVWFSEGKPFGPWGWGALAGATVLIAIGVVLP